jgi:hypothetical protein
VKLSDFPEKSRQGYRTFQKMSGEVAGLFLEKYVSGYAFLRLNHPGTWPDFPEKVREGYGTFRKKTGKVVELSKKSLMKLPDFCKKVRER